VALCEGTQNQASPPQLLTWLASTHLLSFLSQVAHDITTGLMYLHPCVIHRDLKPQNVLLDLSGRYEGGSCNWRSEAAGDMHGRRSEGFYWGSRSRTMASHTAPAHSLHTFTEPSSLTLASLASRTRSAPASASHTREARPTVSAAQGKRGMGPGADLHLPLTHFAPPSSPS
jgi:serine/threonine protein kinase